MPRALIAFSAILVLFSAAGLVETAYPTNSRLESSLCRFQICASAPLIRSARARRLDPAPEAASLGLAESLETLRRDPAAADRWCDAAEALAIAHRPALAEIAFRRAVSLAPNSPPVLMQAANFYFRTGRPAAALPLTSRILLLIRDYDPLVFLLYSRSALPLSRILHDGIPPAPPAARAFFSWLLSPDSPAAWPPAPAPRPPAPAAWPLASDPRPLAWAFLRAHHYDTPALAALYLDRLLAAHLYPAAANFWSDYTRGAERAQAANLVFNPAFRSPFTGLAFDWSPSHTPQVLEQPSPTGLRIHFDGSANLDYYGISQTLLVPHAALRFRAWLKLDRLTTDRGLFFRIYDPESSSRLDLRTPALTGSCDWTPLDLAFTVPPSVNLLRIQLRREPSWKFDNKIAGSALLRSVELVPAP